MAYRSFAREAPAPGQPDAPIDTALAFPLLAAALPEVAGSFVAPPPASPSPASPSPAVAPQPLAAQPTGAAPASVPPMVVAPPMSYPTEAAAPAWRAPVAPPADTAPADTADVAPRTTVDAAPQDRSATPLAAMFRVLCGGSSRASGGAEPKRGLQDLFRRL